MAKIGIYKITNTITNEIYIGASKNIEARLKQHEIGNSSNDKLQISIYGYGIHCFSFEVLEECTKEILFDREFELINEYSKNNKMFNSVYSVEQQQNYELILNEFKSGKYNLKWFEFTLNMPQSTLSHAISGRRKIPSKYLDLLLKELKL